MTKNNTRQKTLSTLGVTTLLKLAQLAADSSHNGEFTISSTGGGFKVAFGAGVLDGAGRFETGVRPTLKEALIAALAGEWATIETAVDESALAAAR
jgi:hypothetical protein